MIAFCKQEKELFEQENSLIRQSLGALLRNDMFSIYERYKDASEVPLRTQEEMESLWVAYHGLGFNHTGDTMVMAGINDQ